MRWLHPPPASTAAFSNARRPGVVLRVSRILAPVPSTALTNRRVRVATPDSRWRKFSATRSAVRIPPARPRTVSTVSPADQGSAVAVLRLNHQRRIDPPEHFDGGPRAGERERFLGENPGGGPLRGIDEKLDRDIPAANILRQRGGDGIINVKALGHEAMSHGLNPDETVISTR